MEKEIIVGGQAVIEGVMMRSPNSYAVAVRLQDGSIISKSEPIPKLSDKYPILGIPVLRGGAILIHSMALGIKALNFSANAAFDIDSPIKDEARSATDAIGSSGSTVASSAGAAGSIVFALFFNVLLFIVMPLLVTNAIFIYFGWGDAPASARAVTSDMTWFEAARTWLSVYMKPVRPSFSFNLIDGVIRMITFVIMIFSMSLMKDIRRVFEYHGAEHKTVYAFEAGLDLTVANAKKFPRQHPRCGTSFLMIVMFVSIILFSIVKFDSLLLNMAIRILLLPVVAGISYEIIRISGKKETSRIFSIITRPGIWLQNLTTKEPSDDQLEVAIYALKESLKLEPVR